MPTYSYKQGVSAWVTHMARTHPVVAAPQLLYFSLLVPSNRRLPGLRCLELFFSQNITDVRFELGHKLSTPFTIHVARIDYLGCPGVARRHCGSLSHLGSLQIISLVCCTFCHKKIPWCGGFGISPTQLHFLPFSLQLCVTSAWAFSSD